MKTVIIVLGTLISSAIIVVLIGFILPVSHVAYKTEHFRSDPGKIYRVLTDVRNYPSWRKDIKKVDIIDRNRWIEHNSANQKIEFQTNMIARMKTWDSAIMSRNLPYGGRWNFELRREGSGSRLAITEYGEVYNPVFRFASRFIMGHSSTIEAYFKDLRNKLGE